MEVLYNDAQGTTPSTSTTKSKAAGNPAQSNFGFENTGDFEPTETLFSTVDQNDFIARKTEPMDIPAVTRLINKETHSVFKTVDFGKLYEKSCFSIVIADVVEPDVVVAAACFSDSPMDPTIKVGGLKWKSNSNTKPMTNLNTFFVHFFASSSEVPAEVSFAKILGNTFNACLPISFILVEAPATHYDAQYWYTPLSKSMLINMGSGIKKKFFVYEKDVMFPHIIIREGREHDLDDLEPLLPFEESVLVKQFGKAILSDVISLSDRNNQSVVAEWDAVAVGIVTVTTDIDYELLNNCFQLETFHGLFKPHPNDELNINPELSTLRFDISEEIPLISSDTVEDNFGEEDPQTTDNPQGQTSLITAEVLQHTADGQRESDTTGTNCSKNQLENYAKRYKVLPDSQFIRSPSPSTDIIENTSAQGTPQNSTEEAAQRIERFLEEIGEADQSDEAVNEEQDKDNQRTELRRSTGEDESLMKENSSDAGSDPCIEDMTKRLTQASLTESSMDTTSKSKQLSQSKGGSSLAQIDTGSENGSSIGTMSSSDSLSLLSKSENGSGSQKSASASEAGSLSDHENISCSDSGNPTISTPSGSNASLSFHSSNEELPESEIGGVGGGDGAERRVTTAESGEMDSELLYEQSDVNWTEKTEIQPATEEEAEENEDSGDWPEFVKAQAELIDIVESVAEYAEYQGFDLNTDRDKFSQHYNDVLRDADLYIQDTIVKCIPKALPDEKALPFELLAEASGSVYHGLPNAIAIQIFALEPRYHMRVHDLIKGAFHNFPNREYLIVTVPTGSREPFWLEEFVRVAPRNQSLYSRELFVYHRAVLGARIIVREALDKDAKRVQELVESLYDKYKVYTDYEEVMSSKAAERMRAFVAVVTSHEAKPIIGLAIVSPDRRQTMYQVNYDLDRYTYIDFHAPPEEGQLYLNHFIISPIFQRFSKLFMKEILRLTEKTCFFHSVYPDCIHNEATEHQTVLNNLDDLIPLLPRKRIDYVKGLNLTEKYDDERCPCPYITEEYQGFSVMHFAKKFSFDPKCNLNERIVFIGASETTISCLEMLISSPYRSYKHLTVIDPFGIPGTLPPDHIRDMFFVKKGGKAMSFQSEAERARRIGLNSYVNICYGWVTKIIRKNKLVVVNEHTLVPYDILVIATGMQFHRPDCPTPEIEDPHILALKKNDRNNGRPSTIKKFNRLTPKPKNVFTINTEVEASFALAFLRAGLPYIRAGYILVYGLCLESFACIRALLALGISAKRIVFIIPPKDTVKWEINTGYETAPMVETTMIKVLKNFQISIYENCVFHSWWVDESSHLAKRVYFDSTLTDKRVSFPCMALFAYCHKRVHDIIVGALTESYIFYKEGEGIIIDTKLKTVDPNVWAAGPATVYQMALKADKYKHAYFQSEDIGRHVAESIIRLTQNVGGSVISLDLFLPPEFKNPLIRAAQLPGGWNYLYIRPPGVPSGCSPAECDSCDTGAEIITGSLEETEDNPRPKYFRLWLDDFYKVVEVDCLSRKKFPASNLAGLYGQHETLLNKLLEKMEKGEVVDLYDHFCQPWFGVFCHDRWMAFKQELRELYTEQTTGDDQVKILEFIRDYLNSAGDEDSIQVDPNILRHVWDRSGVKTKIENRFLDFLIFNRTSVPMYARPDFVEKVLEERKQSTVYQKKPQQY